MKNLELSRSEQIALLHKVQAERDFSFQTMLNKRQLWREQDKLLNNTSNPDKIDLKTIFYITETMLALHYADTPTVKYLAEDNTERARQISRNRNRIIKSDARVLNMPVMDFWVQLNRLMRGVALRIRDGWDTRRNCPKWKVVSPLQWFPDPRGAFGADEFAFHGFEFTTSKLYLQSQDGYFDLDKIKASQQKESAQEMLTRQQAEQANNLNPFSMDRDPTGNAISIYHHETDFDSKKYGHIKVLTSCVNDAQDLVRVQQIEPVYEYEMDDPLSVPFSVVMNHYFPQKYSPSGVSLVDLLQDKHRFKNVMANLMFLREKDLALGDDVIYDENLIKNPANLASTQVARKFMGADGNKGDIQKAAAVIPKNPTQPSGFNIMGQFDKWVQDATSTDEQARGVLPSTPGDTTATQTMTSQSNSNIKTLFKSNINKVGETEFWRQHMRGYAENMGLADKKKIHVAMRSATRVEILEKSDFVTGEVPELEITTKREIQQTLSQQKADLVPYLMATINNPNKPVYAKTAAERKLLELSEVDEEETFEYAPMTAEEADAMRIVPLLDLNIMDAADIRDMDVDHASYMAIFMTKALPTAARDRAIENRRKAIFKMSQHKQKEAPDSQNFAAMAGSQLMGQAAGKRNDGVTKAGTATQ